MGNLMPELTLPLLHFKSRKRTKNLGSAVALDLVDCPVFSQQPGDTAKRRKIRLIEGNAKCRHKKTDL